MVVGNIMSALSLQPFSRVSKRCNRATVQISKTIQRLRKIWVFERENAQFITILPFWGKFCNYFVVFFPILFAQNFLTQILVAQKNMTVRKCVI